MTITPSYVGEPECNGVIERVETLAEAQRIIGEFIARYNAEWLIANGLRGKAADAACSRCEATLEEDGEVGCCVPDPRDQCALALRLDQSVCSDTRCSRRWSERFLF